MVNSTKIIVSKEIKVTANGLLILTTEEKVAFCPLKEISDIPIDVKSYFAKYTNYKFYICAIKKNLMMVSYKKCHPILNLEKNKIYPTASHSSNLMRNFRKEIEQYSFDK